MARSDLPSGKSLETKSFLTKQQAHSIAEFLRILSNANRLKMICALMHREMCKEELAKTVGLSQSAVFQHLIVLIAGRLLHRRKISATTYYQLCPQAVADIQTVQKLLEQARAINLFSPR
ncbi:ArsR/SmtB family transcription factor [Brucella pituitosa]|uniref:ArsR/SmtB family transcription factor n=1 Tax=Brucella pituitosa TaxID=571256 RepID=UPI0009A238AD|nr:metalloregulator ArsR/SmtB family transcription factor [Brucella pituitosa]